MTGFGEAHSRQENITVKVEIRAINNRFLKLVVHGGEDYISLEPLVESVVRQTIHRGTVQVNFWVDRKRSPEDYRLNLEVLERYRRQLVEVQRNWGCSTAEVSLDALLSLPGVVEDTFAKTEDALADWPLVEQTLRAALEKLQTMRREEGRAMYEDLTANCQAVLAGLQRIEQRAPLVVEESRRRLQERLSRVLNKLQIGLEPNDLLKEVVLLAERSDISEEIVRLRSNVEQFQAALNLPESAGRKLDFLCQEMFREANTIGAKAGDLEIAHEVIEIKTAIERIREMVQNVE